MRTTLLFLLALAACGDDEPGLDLDERRFRLQSGREPVSGTMPALTFDEGELNYFAGCNNSSGGYAVRGGKLVTEDLASTEIGCDPDLLRQDQFFQAFLAARPAITLNGATLTLTGADATLVFVADE